MGGFRASMRVSREGLWRPRARNDSVAERRKTARYREDPGVRLTSKTNSGRVRRHRRRVHRDLLWDELR